RLPRLDVLHPPALPRSAAAGRVIHIHPTRLQLPQLAATTSHGSHQFIRGQGGAPVPPGPHPRRSLVQHHAPHTVHQHHGAVRNLATHRTSQPAERHRTSSSTGEPHPAPAPQPAEQIGRAHV